MKEEALQQTVTILVAIDCTDYTRLRSLFRQLTDFYLEVQLFDSAQVNLRQELSCLTRMGEEEVGEYIDSLSTRKTPWPRMSPFHSDYQPGRN